MDAELNVSRLRSDAHKLATPKEYAALMMIWGGLGDDMPGSVRKSPPGRVQDVAASSGVSAEQLYAIEAMLAKGYKNLIPILEADPALLPSPPLGVTLAHADGIAVRPRERRARRSRSSANRGDPSRLDSSSRPGPRRGSLRSGRAGASH